MSDKVFVDTNVLVYAHDKDAGRRHAVATRLVTELWETRRARSDHLRSADRQPLRRRSLRPPALVTTFPRHHVPVDSAAAPALVSPWRSSLQEGPCSRPAFLTGDRFLDSLRGEERSGG